MLARAPAIAPIAIRDARARARASVSAPCARSVQFSVVSTSNGLELSRRNSVTLAASRARAAVSRVECAQRMNVRASAALASAEPAPALLVRVPLALGYVALTVASGCNAFMWTLDLSNPIIPTAKSFVIGRLCVAIGATLLAALNFWPQASKQLGRAHRAFSNAASSERLKLDAAKFAALVMMKMCFEYYAYWMALTSFTPCTQSMELCAWYGLAFIGHAAFMGLANTVIAADGASSEMIPTPVRKLIGGFDLVLALMCVATSKLAMSGYGVASALVGFAFLIAGIYFTFEDKLPKKPATAKSS